MSETQFYRAVEQRDDWAFCDVPRSQTREITHSYHKYPAKFIPQLARALINEYTKEGDSIWDPFCGSGTLNLEAFRTFRHSIGTDVSPVAVLISRAKTIPLEPERLRGYSEALLKDIHSDEVRSESFYVSQQVLNGNEEMLRKWFPHESLLELAHILWHIKKRQGQCRHRDFALCAFSSILKRSSFWLNSSVKAQVDPDKTPKEPLFYFRKQLRAMEKANEEFWEEVKDNETRVDVFRHNARHRLPARVQKVDCIITSPPYLVSYDYSDIFRLSTYFLFYQEDYGNFRRSFTGTSLRRRVPRNLGVSAGDQLLVDSVSDTGIRRSLAQYYRDMRVFLKNARNHLKSSGGLIMVVGDTEFRGARVPNAYLLFKIAATLGWSLGGTYERLIPVKILPTFRDESTGRFTSRENSNHSERYEKEYVLVLRR